MLTVIGCGNPARSDDGVGVFVAQALQAHVHANPRPDVRVFDAGTAGMQVMFQAVGTRQLILVDAARTGSPPGAIFRVPGAELETEHAPGYSLHDFRWDHALAAGRKIYRERFPSDVTVYLIELQSCAFGLELSAKVRESAAQVVAEIRRTIDDYAVDGLSASQI
jgi:hydrogenase maturation protease